MKLVSNRGRSCLGQSKKDRTSFAYFEPARGAGHVLLLARMFFPKFDEILTSPFLSSPANPVRKEKQMKVFSYRIYRRFSGIDKAEASRAKKKK